MATAYADLVRCRRPGAGPLAATVILPRAVVRVPVRAVVPVPRPADALETWQWTGVDRLLLPVAWLLAAWDRAPGRHRRDGGPVRSHRAGGTR